MARHSPLRDSGPIKLYRQFQLTRELTAVAFYKWVILCAGLGPFKTLIERGVRSLGWQLRHSVECAQNDGDLAVDLVAAIADVIAARKQIAALT